MLVVLRQILDFVHDCYIILRTLWFGIYGIIRFLFRMIAAVPILIESFPLWLVPLCIVGMLVGVGLFCLNRGDCMQSVIDAIVVGLTAVWRIMHRTIFTLGGFSCSLFDVLLAFLVIDLILMFVFRIMTETILTMIKGGFYVQSDY